MLIACMEHVNAFLLYVECIHATCLSIHATCCKHVQEATVVTYQNTVTLNIYIKNCLFLLVSFLTMLKKCSKSMRIS